MTGVRGVRGRSDLLAGDVRISFVKPAASVVDNRLCKSGLRTCRGLRKRMYIRLDLDIDVPLQTSRVEKQVLFSPGRGV